MQTQEEIIQSIKRRQEKKNEEFGLLLEAGFPFQDWQYAKLNYYVRKNGEDENVKQLIQKIYDSRDGKTIYDFAYNYNYSNLQDLSCAMAKTKDGEYIHRFSLDFGDADQEKLLLGLLNCGDDFWQIKAFFENEKLDKTQRANLIRNVFTNRNGVKLIHIINNKIGKNGRLPKELMQIMSEQLMANPNYLFVKQIVQSIPLDMGYISKRLNTCYVLSNPDISVQDMVLDFAKTVPNADMTALTDLMIKHGNAHGIYVYATECGNVNIKQIAKYISQHFGSDILQIALDDIGFQKNIVPKYEEQIYNNRVKYYEDVLLKVKAYKKTDYYKAHKKQSGTSIYEAKIISR